MLRELRSLFRARGVPPQECSDLAQETVLRTLVHLKRHGQTSEDVGPLARTIARNLLIGRIRRRQVEVVPLSAGEEVADDSQQPLDQIVAGERQQAVRAAVRSLSPRHRRVVHLWMEGMTPARIAQELGIKRNAVDALLHRARRRLAKDLEPSHLGFGLIGLVYIRLRGAFRRIADTVSGLDPSGSFANATTGIAAAGLVAVLSVATPMTGNSRTDTPVRSGERVAVLSVGNTATALSNEATSGAPHSHGLIREADSPEAGGPEVVTDLRRHRVGAETEAENPATGDEETVFVDIWHDKEDGDESTMGEVLYDATDGACARLTVGCRKVEPR